MFLAMTTTRPHDFQIRPAISAAVGQLAVVIILAIAVVLLNDAPQATAVRSLVVLCLVGPLAAYLVVGAPLSALLCGSTRGALASRFKQFLSVGFIGVASGQAVALAGLVAVALVTNTDTTSKAIGALALVLTGWFVIAAVVTGVLIQRQGMIPALEKSGKVKR